LKSIPTLETSSSEKDRSLEVLRAMFKRTRLMIIKLRKYNEIRELLIENRTTGSQAHLSYWDGDANRHRGTYNQPQVRIKNKYAYEHCRAIREVLACKKIEIDWKIKRVGTLRSQVHQLRGLPMRWCKWHMVA